MNLNLYPENLVSFGYLFLNLYRWIRDQQKSEGVAPGEDVYIILRLDGRVRRSGKVNAHDGEFMIDICFSFLAAIGKGGIKLLGNRN